MNKGGQAGFSPIVIILLLVVGIGVGLFLVKTPQIFEPKATNSNDYANAEFGSTLLKEYNLYPKSSNNIDTMGFFMFQQELEEPVAPGRPQGFGLTQEKAEFISKQYEYLWINGFFKIREDCNLPPPNSLKVDPTCYNHDEFSKKTTWLKSLNPQLKLGLAGTGGGVFNPTFLLFTYINPVTDLLHKNGQIINNSPNHFYFNIGDTTVRKKVVDSFEDIFKKHPQLDGVFIDNYASSHLQPELKTGCDEKTTYACNTFEYWRDGLTSFSSELKNGIISTTGKQVDTVYNGIGYFGGRNNPPWPQNSGKMNEGWINHHDGALVENLDQIYTGIAGNPTEFTKPAVAPEIVFEDYMNTFKWVTEGNKKLFFWIMPQMIDIHWPGYPYKNDLDMERYFLATYLLIQRKGFTYFGYHPDGPKGPGEPNRQGGQYLPYHVYFYRDWNLDFGLPNAPFVKDPTGLFIRLYTNGVVIVNPTAKPIDYTLFAGNFRVWNDLDKQVSGKITIPARSGNFYFNSVLPSSSPTTIPSPSSTVKLGDLDKDGDVDVFDLSLFIQDLKNNNLRSDFDHNGKVDIFDFNLLIKNFSG